MKVLIDISEDVFTRLFDNGVDASIDDLRQLETTVRKGTPIPKEKSAAAKIFFAINKLGGNNPKTDDEMTIGQAIEFLDNFNLDCERECPNFSITSDDCKDGCKFVKAVNTIKKCTFVNVTEEELEDIKADLCDNYCAKRKEWTGDQDDFIEEICVNCPLTRL